MHIYCPCLPHCSVKLLTVSNWSAQGRSPTWFLWATSRVIAKAFWSALNCFIWRSLVIYNLGLWKQVGADAFGRARLRPASA